MCVCVLRIERLQMGESSPPISITLHRSIDRGWAYALTYILSLLGSQNFMFKVAERERERARATAISWWISRVLRRNDNFDVWPNRTVCITLDKPDHTGSLPLPFSCHSIEHTPSVCVYADIFLCVSAICECAKSHSSINFGHFLFSLLL